MSNSGVTLNRLFGLDGISLDPEAIGSKEAGTTFARQAAGKAGPLWAAIRKRIPEQLSTLMGIDAADVLVGAWNKTRELRKYRDPLRYPPEQVILLPLAKHRIQSKHEPFVEITIDGQVIGTVRFQIEIDLTLEGAELKIQAGRIKEIRLGQCAGKGTIKCEGAVLGEAERRLTLPGTIDLHDGIAIPE
jgi:hypothetical protein